MGLKKGNYKPRLTVEDSKKICELYLEGKTQQQIAFVIGRSRSTVRHILNRSPELGANIPKYLKSVDITDNKERDGVDLSSLPDDILFEHSKEYII